MKVLKMAVLAMVVTVSGMNVYSFKHDSSMSDMTLANVEALANDEGIAAGSPCYVGNFNSNMPSATKCANPCYLERCSGTVDHCY